MDRAAFVAAMIEELRLQKEQEASGGPPLPPDADAQAYAAMCFDMPTVAPAWAGQLAATLASCLGTGAGKAGSSAAPSRRPAPGPSTPDAVLASLPPWCVVSPRFLAGLLYCAERAASASTQSLAAPVREAAPGSSPLANLAAVVFIKLARALLTVSPAPDTACHPVLVSLLEANLNVDAISGMAPADFGALGVVEDACSCVTALLENPTPHSRHWTKHLYLLRDYAMAHPECGSPVLEGIMTFVRPAAKGSDAVVTSFVNRCVLVVVCELIDSPALARVGAFQRAVLLSIRRLLVGPLSRSLSVCVCMFACVCVCVCLSLPLSLCV